MSLEKEFTSLIEQNKGIIYKVIRLYVCDPEDERDLFQEILFQAWKSYTRFKGESKFSTWLYRVGLNTVLTFKSRPSFVDRHEDINALHAVAHERTEDDTEALYVAIRELGEIDRMIILLHLEGYENDEIGDITGLQRGHVAVKLYRVKIILKNKLSAE